MTRERNLTLRQGAEIAGGSGGLKFVGMPQAIADRVQHSLAIEAPEGFNGMVQTA